MRESYYIYIFRHGQTTFNRDKIFTGWENPSLTESGISDAKCVANKLKNKKFEIAIRSSLNRSKQTLDEVLVFHPECKKTIIDDEIIERSYGILNGISHDNFIKLTGEQLLNLQFPKNNFTREEKNNIIQFLGRIEYDSIHRGWKNKALKGESFEDVEKRVRKFIESLVEIMEENKTDIAISAHGNSIRLFRKIIEDASISKATRWFIPYDKVYKYKVTFLKKYTTIRRCL